MRKIGFVVYPQFQVMAFAAMSVFEFANQAGELPLYDVQLISETGGLVLSSLGMLVDTKSFGRKTFDTLIVSGGNGAVSVSPGLLRQLKRHQKTTRRIGSICTGAFALAEAGLLDGKRTTTHWAYAKQLQSSFPSIKMEQDRIFIVDGPIWTSAGMTAGIDLALAMIEKDHGFDLARQVSKKLVVYHRRAGGQSQFSALLEMEPKSDRIRNALAYAKSNLKNALTVEELADAAHLSPRQLSRAFRSETGTSPAKAIENLRLESARLMMEEGRLPAQVVAIESGFADSERMRRAFLRAFGQPPQVLRRAASMQESVA